MSTDSKKRRLATETYTEAEKEQISKLLNIKYDTAAEGEEVPEIAEVQLVEATKTYLEFLFSFTIPLAVSKDPNDADTLTIEFDDSLFKDPLTDLDVNKGESLIIVLPRQIDSVQAAALASSLDAA